MSSTKGKTAVDYGLKPFESLQTSTSTIMVYTNVIFDKQKIFESIKLTEIDVPLTKKQGNPDKKKLVAPYGAIVSVQYQTYIRGIDLRKKKKRWCTVCQPIKVSQEGEETKIMTVTEKLDPVEGTDMFAIKYFCAKCQKTYKPEELYKINHFLNQVTIVLSTGTQPLLNVMLFRDSLKFAGCKGMDDAVEGTLILWQDCIFSPKETSKWYAPAGSDSSAYASTGSDSSAKKRKGLVFDPSRTQGPSNTIGTDLWRLKKGAKTPRFVFENVMKNVDFRIGWAIERPALNLLMNDEKYADNIFMSQYESTGHTNVNIKMYSRKPAGFTYDCLVIPLDEKKAPGFIKLTDIPYKSEKKKKKDASKDKYVTFIAFSSSEIILSGRYDKNMEEMYNFFVKTVFSHRKHIEERLDDANEGEISKIKRRVGAGASSARKI